MVAAALRRYRPVIQIALWSAVGLTALVLLAITSVDSAQFGTWRLWVLIGSVVGVVVLALLLTRKLAQLMRNYRQLAPGARLTGRTVLLFGPLVVVPLVIVYLFSLEFLNRGVDSWFRIEVRQGLSDALALSRSALDLRMREVADRNSAFAESLTLLSDGEALSRLDDERRESSALELVLYGADGRVIGASSETLPASMPPAPADELLRQVASGEPFVSLEPQSRGQYLIRTAAPLGSTISGKGPRFLLAIHEVPPRLAALAEAVQTSYSRYGNIADQREPLLAGFRLTLTLVLLAVMLAALYGAIFSAQLLFKPIQDLMEGTRAVAKGDLGTRLPLSTRDEMGFLVQSFNDMTKRLRRAREEAERNQRAVEGERTRLATILGRLSSGVMVFDREGVLRTANESAGTILGPGLADRIGANVVELAGADERTLLGQFARLLARHFAAGHNDFREQFDLQGPAGRRHLMCAAVPLALGAGSELPDHVVVFDDITALLTAQREAAWGEVARRLAHEIKNPLTPIQLSAERMRRRYLGVMTGQDAEVIDRATHTIVQQVESMKRMVNAFSEYARAPDVHLTAFSLNQLVREVCELYRPQNSAVRVEVDLDPRLEDIRADRGRIRQILNNLLANAQEALELAASGLIEVRTRLVQNGGDLAELVVADNGPGFAREILDRAFDPYVTSKPRGTGLGLAIVKKIAEEHGGSIVANNRVSGGAELCLRLPLQGIDRVTASRERRSEKAKELA
jgi:nitrogen fixation/metabolism regulation signal transduction histidine kinase